MYILDHSLTTHYDRTDNCSATRHSQTDIPAADAPVRLGRQRFVGALAGQIVQAIAHRRRIEALLLQVELLQLERAGHVHARQQAHELRSGVRRQQFADAGRQIGQIQVGVFVHDGCHARTTFQIGDLYGKRRLQLEKGLSAR